MPHSDLDDEQWQKFSEGVAGTDKLTCKLNWMSMKLHGKLGSFL